MIEIVSIDEISTGDIILIEGMKDRETCIITVSKKPEEGLITPVEMGGMDYAPGKPDEIVRLGNVKKAKSKPIITVSAMDISLGLNTKWIDIVNNGGFND